MSDVYHLADEGVGYLDMRDYNRARWAYDMSHPASPFMEWLKTAGHVRFEVEDVRVSGSADPVMPIAETTLAWQEITRISNELNKWPGVEEAAHDKFGASLLIDLGREVSTAVHRWPMEDKPHRMDSLRCGGCEQLTLVYHPPRFEGDRIIVNCGCGYELAEGEFELAVALIEKEEKGRVKSA